MINKTGFAGLRQTTLGEIAVEQLNNGIFRKNPEYVEDGGDGMPVVWVEELFRGTQINTANSRKLKPTSTEVKKYGLRHGDILFCRSSLKLDGIGFSNVYTGEDFQALFECHVIRISPNPKLVFPKFLNHQLRTEHLRNLIKSRSKTSTMTTIDQKGLCAVPICLPSLEDQRRIAAILDQADALKAKRREALAQLDSLTQSIFIEMFGNPVINPKGWPLRFFGELGSNQDSQRVPVKSSDRDGRSGQFPYYGASGIIDWIDEYIYEGERLLVGEDGANLLARVTPIAYMARGKFWVNNHAHVIAENGYANLRFLEFFLQQFDLTPYISGSAQPKLNRGNLDRIPIPCPPLALQNLFALQIGTIEKHIASLQAHELELNVLFASLQHRAFQGEL